MHIYFRCDFGLSVGLGHLMRCISLSQAFMKNPSIHTTLLCNQFDDKMRPLLEEAFSDVEVFQKLTEGLDFDIRVYFNKTKKNIVIFDHYDVTYDGMKRVRSLCDGLVAVDDLANRSFSVDMIINQNSGAENLHYRVDHEKTILCLGQQYVLLRRNILEALPNIPTNQSSKAVFMSFGGGAVYQRLLPVISALKQLDELLKETIMIYLVLPGENQEQERLEKFVCSFKQIKFHYVKQSFDLSVVMLKCHFAITAAGSTIFELAYLGIPQLVFMIDQNQKVNAENIEACKIGKFMGKLADFDSNNFVKNCQLLLENKMRHGKMRQEARAAIDGKGADRVVSKIHNAFSGANVELYSAVF